MAAHHLEIRDESGALSDFSGSYGHVVFAHGVSVQAYDPGHFMVRRLIRVQDGGGGLVPSMRIARGEATPVAPAAAPASPQPPATTTAVEHSEPPPVPAPPPTVEPTDRMAKARAALAAKRAARDSAGQ